MINNRGMLVAFEKVAKLGTTHAAALELGLTQTAITQRIKALESQLDVTLFLRSRRGMAVTEEGKTLLHYQAAIQELDAQFMARLKGNQRRDVSLTIVGPTSAISTRVAENCSTLFAKFPFLRLHLRSEDQLNCVDLVKRGIADFAIIPAERVPNEMDSKQLKPDRYLLVASAKWKNRKLVDIFASERIIDFSESDRTTTNYLRQFKLDGPVLRDRLFVNENAALIQYFIKGIGFGTLTEAAAKPYLANGDLITLNKGMAMLEPLALIWYPRTNRTEYFDDIVRSLK